MPEEEDHWTWLAGFHYSCGVVVADTERAAHQADDTNESPEQRGREVSLVLPGEDAALLT